MNILGVCNANDSGAGLIVDGKIVAAANEERFTRKKLTKDFPKNAIRYVLREGSLSLADIDWVGCGAWKGIDPRTTLQAIIDDCGSHAADPAAYEVARKRIEVTGNSDANASAELYKRLAEMGVPAEKVVCCDHHYSHAVTAFYCSPFEESWVYVADGRGDYRSVTLWKGTRDAGLTLVDFATELTSPGAFYGQITKHLGFIPDRHEGKLTGLSARGKMSPAYDAMKRGYFYDTDLQKIRSRFDGHYLPFVTSEPAELQKALANCEREDIAFAAQKILEETLIALLLKHISKFEDKPVNLCLAGGCMSNVKLNFEFSRLLAVKNIYVFPQMGDGGNGLGGAMHVAITRDGRKRFDLPNVYLGPGYDNDEILAELKQHELKYRKLEPGEKAPLVADLLARDNIIGWFQGRMEYGPRALGARSILAQAVDPAITDTLNHRLQRSDFMPFAPVTIESLAADCFVGWRPDHEASKFMTTCYHCTPMLNEKCPAIVHVDNTARPQVVFRPDNPEYHDVVKLYAEKTGIPTIINTSFNHHEEPIVNSPNDAIRSFFRDNVDYLVIGDYLVEPAASK